MRVEQIEECLSKSIPVQYLAQGLGWLPDGWHDVQIAGIDSNLVHPRVWLNIGNAGQIIVECKKDIKERLRKGEYACLKRNF